MITVDCAMPHVVWCGASSCGSRVLEGWLRYNEKIDGDDDDGGGVSVCVFICSIGATGVVCVGDDEGGDGVGGDEESSLVAGEEHGCDGGCNSPLVGLFSMISTCDAARMRERGTGVVKSADSMLG